MPVKVKSKPFMQCLLLSQRDTAQNNRHRSFRKSMKIYFTPGNNSQGWFIFESHVLLDISTVIDQKDHK